MGPKDKILEVLTKYRGPVTTVSVAFALVAVAKLIGSRKKKGKEVPEVEGGLPFFGHVFTMVAGSPWDTMAAWARKYGGIYKLHLFGSSAFVVSDPDLLKVILSTKLSVFKKDLAWTYKPFLDILGNGIVTADGDDWWRQRKLLSAHLRIDILEDIPNMAIRAVQRLMQKLDKARAEGATVEMAEEFRHLTLQVVAEAFMSLPPEESDQTFAHMYLPIGKHPQSLYIERRMLVAQLSHS
jgi:cytochrome P450